MEQLFVSRTEAAKALGISIRKLDYMLSEGQLAARKLGRRTLIARRTLEAFAGDRKPPKESEGKCHKQFKRDEMGVAQ